MALELTEYRNWYQQNYSEIEESLSFKRRVQIDL